VQVAFVLWTGEIGGAEILAATLADRMRRKKIDARIVFVVREGPLVDRLERASVPFSTLGVSRGRDVCWRPRAFARLVSAHGRDGAVLIEANYLAAALRLGGYRARLVATEHGAIFLHERDSLKKRASYDLGRLLGSRAIDVEVAVSEAALIAAKRHFHTSELVKIPSGVDLTLFRPSGEQPASGAPFVIGYVGRLDEGKGVELLVDSVLSIPCDHEINVRIAGTGPLQQALQARVAALPQDGRIIFEGLVDDIPAFWAKCSLAVAPSDISENVPLAVLEAMACGKPVVASRLGGVPEIVIDGETGVLFPPGDHEALVRAIVRYVNDPALAMRHGAEGRSRCELEFDIDDTARSYIDLFDRDIAE
jgi:glycosyltransferase involved in cell wall biosynthesis